MALVFETTKRCRNIFTSHVTCNFLIALLLLCGASAGLACTIFETTDGVQFFVGNNEDNEPGHSAFLWFEPRTQGAVGYVLWGAERETPEGGLNDQGLFFDAAALPMKIPIVKDTNKKDFDAYMVEPVLKRCRSVQEALDFMSNFNLVDQEKAQIFLADARGDVAVVHANYTVRKPQKEKSFVLTNFSLALPPADQPPCWRRRAAQAMLTEAPLTTDRIATILDATAQRDPDNATVWSNAINLSTRTFKFYQNHDFSHPVLIDLPVELKKGARQVMIKNLFPQSLVEWVKRHGVSVQALREVDPGRTDGMQEWSDAGEFLFFAGRTADAVMLYREAARRFPALARACSELGIALEVDGKVDEATAMYTRALALDPSDHCANLFAARGSKVAFRLRRYLTADQVTVVGNFSGDNEESIKLHKDNDAWVANIPARPGPHYYSLNVDSQYITDPDNSYVLKPAKYLKSVAISK